MPGLRRRLPAMMRLVRFLLLLLLLPPGLARADADGDGWSVEDGESLLYGKCWRGRS